MTAEPRIIRTEAEQALSLQFEDTLGDLPGGERVAAFRAAAFDKFRRAGLPHRRVEEYKYTDLRALMKKAALPARRPTETAAHRALTEARDPLEGVERHRLVLVDGHFFDALSDRPGLAAVGVDVSSAALAMKADGEVAARLFATPEMAAGDIALALNAMFATDGVEVTVRDGVAIDKPLEILHISTGAEAHASAVRSAIRIGAGANLKVIETFRGPDGVAHQVNATTEISVGKGATVAWTRLQAEGDWTQHLGTTLLSLAAGARFDHLTVTAGASVSRSQVFLTTGGNQTRLGIYGVTMIGGRQHADTTLLIDHALPGATTRVLVKSAVDDEAQGVFQGKIVVEPDAQKTDARMMSKALLLSDSGEFDAKPELEIFADDVQCGHGATSGRIDDEHLFYLMARGVARAEAERLLIEAFLDEAIDAMDDGAIGTALKRTVTAWLNKRGTRAA
ncbi:MAG: Fe-S cluster assembly protein SufD [Bauldia sp.]